MNTTLKRKQGLRRKTPLKTRTRLKRTTGLRKKASKGIAGLKNEAWKLFSIWIRYRDAFQTTGTFHQVRCVSCQKLIPTFGVGCAHAGHFIPGRHNRILFNQANVHAQCFVCNKRKGGNWPEYIRFMTEAYGQDKINELLRLDKEICTFSRTGLEAFITELKQKIETIRSYEVEFKLHGSQALFGLQNAPCWRLVKDPAQP